MSINIIDAKLKFKGTFKPNNPECIILHHALSNHCSIFDVHQWHLQNGWIGFGYHFFISKAGRIYKGRDVKNNGSHTKEKEMNRKSIGICLEGCYTDYEDMTEKTVPVEQYNSLIELTKYLMKEYTVKKIFPHNHFANYKDCPGKYFPFDKYISDCFDTEKKKNWMEILKECTDSPERWEDAILSVIKKNVLSDEKELEIFKFLPDLIEKVYYK